MIQRTSDGHEDERRTGADGQRHPAVPLVESWFESEDDRGSEYWDELLEETAAYRTSFRVAEER